MPRRARISIPGISSHIIQRGNNRQTTFYDDTDKKKYLNWLQKYSAEFDVAIHAWVFMSNHVHILCTPNTNNGISLMMQSIGRVYVKYFNKKYQRTGTLWEGRFKSCLVHDEVYLLEIYRYIELNPVRAGMVNDPSDYAWSSYQSNGLGRFSRLLRPHSLYLELGKSVSERLVSYRVIVRERLSEELLISIREASHNQLALGNNQFIKEAESLCGKKLTKSKMGRPVTRPSKSEHLIS